MRADRACEQTGDTTLWRMLTDGKYQAKRMVAAAGKGVEACTATASVR
jgi:hypothetical protein